MRVSQANKDKIQALIEFYCSVLRLFVAIEDRFKRMGEDAKPFTAGTYNISRLLKALRRKYWGFSRKKILYLLERDQEPRFRIREFPRPEWIKFMGKENYKEFEEKK